MSEDELKVTRRLFLQHSAVASAVSAGACGIAMKTDAQAQVQETGSGPLGVRTDGVLPYMYTE